MEQNLSLYEDKLQFYLIYSPDGQLSEHMLFAREKLEENVNKNNIKNVTLTECVSLSGNFTRKHIVVFDEFEGEGFETIKKTPALVLGPRCVISCMMDNVTLPDIDSPMYNLCMRDLIVCLSSFDVQEKANLKRLIGYMGGRCIDQLAQQVTHLVADSVRTKKYEIAVTQKMKIMKSSWIYDAWAKAKEENILATSSQFEEHKLPVFYKLRVTTTGLGRREKKEVEDLVNKEGGQYFGEFSSTNIDVVIAKRNATETPKLKAAMGQRKDCLCVEWIHDSCRKGSALPLESYLIDLQAKKITSTPERSPASSTLCPVDVSNINVSTVNDTAMSNLSISSEFGMSRKRKSNEMANDNKDLSYKAAYEKLNFLEAKRAGAFLDSCTIYICGFTNEEKDKIKKILNAGSATIYDSLNSNLTHILIGNPSKKDVNMLRTIPIYNATMVKLDWLVESIIQKTAVDGDRFVYDLNNGKPNALAIEQATAPSPASKRNIILMSQSSKQGTPKRLNFDGNASLNNQSLNNSEVTLQNHQESMRAQAEDEIIDQYLKVPAPVPVAPEKEPVKPVEPVASTSKEIFKVPTQPPPPPADESEFDLESDFSVTLSRQVKFLEKLKVHIRGFDNESHESLVEDCQNAGAEVIENDNYKGVVDFLILPLDALTMNGVQVQAKKIVNHNWLINAKRLYEVTDGANNVADPLLDIPYFYEPIFFPEELRPLNGMTIGISLYTSDERAFLVEMAQILGAEWQESLCRSSKPLLICPEAKSAKYEAAIRWRLPVVNKKWLLDCYKLKKRLPLRNYLVGDAIAPIDDIEDEDEEVMCSQPGGHVDPKDLGRESAFIPNKRVEQLRGAKSKSKSPLSPRIEHLRNANSKSQSPSSPIIPTVNYDEVLRELDTPTRNSILERFKELDAETPQTKRRRYERQGIKSPEEATTPYWMEHKRQQCEERRMRHAPTQEQIEKIQNRVTETWSEVKRNLWKEALGDEYESPSQCYSMNMQSGVPPNDKDAGRSTGRKLQYDPPEETEPDENIQALADFINKNKQHNNEPEHYADVPNTMPADSEMINSEQHEVIGWRDPSEVVEDTPKRNPKPKSTHCFSISCSTDEIKHQIIAQITELNGKVCENLLTYDSSCTHFVCEKPSRSEKMLSCVAAGKWVLSLNYIQKSYEAKRFINEEEFEWGNPKAKSLPRIDGSDLSFANASHRWRKKLASIMIPSSKGIFKDFRVILKTSKDESLRTVIEAGRGQVIDVDKNLPLNKQTALLSNATHIICQGINANFTADELKSIEQFNVYAVNMNYLQQYILSETTPDIQAYLFKPAKS